MVKSALGRSVCTKSSHEPAALADNRSPSVDGRSTRPPMHESLRRARRPLLLRSLVRRIGLAGPYRTTVLGGAPFPRPTDPARLAEVLRAARARVPYYRANLPELPVDVDPR